MKLHRRVGKGLGADERIRRQAELLALARHPGVVELVGVEGGPDRPVLVTVFVDGPTLAAPPPLTVEEMAGVVRALASTLADLHDLGIVHGAVTPDHVLVGRDGPVLCGLGAAGRVGEAGPGGDELLPSDDVAALGRLLRRLATGPDARALRGIAGAATSDDPGARPSARDMASALGEAVPGARLPVRGPEASDRLLDLRSLVVAARSDRRGLAVRRRSAGGGGLAGVGAAAVRPRRLGEDPGRHSASRLATALDDGDPAAEDDAGWRGSAPDATTNDLPRPRLRVGGGRRPPVRSMAISGGVAAVGAVAVLHLAPWASSGPTAEQPVAPAPPATATNRPQSSSTSVAPTSSVHASPRAGCRAPTSVLVADVDGDGCLDALQYADGVLEAAGLRWALGRAGDQVATGDWSCRGERTVVLLRPSTGQVFRFDAWAVGSSDSVAGSAVAVVPDGQAVRAADVDRDGCHELVVERGELPPQVVRLARTRP